MTQRGFAGEVRPGPCRGQEPRQTKKSMGRCGVLRTPARGWALRGVVGQATGLLLRSREEPHCVLHYSTFLAFKKAIN